MSLLQNSLVIRRQVSPLHEGIDNVSRRHSIGFDFKRILFKTFTEDLALKQVPNLTIDVLVLQM